MEMFIPDSYVTNITERYNLYTELSKIENDVALAAFESSLADRFGPVPQPVKTMMDVLRMQWIGKSLGFEKLSFKKGILRGYFITNKQSPYFDSEQFNRILMFAQLHPRICNLKEVKNSLRIAFDSLNTVEEAIEMLQSI